MKKNTILQVVRSVLMVSLLCFSFREGVCAEKKPYKIGLNIELSGPVAFAGIEPRDAIVMEVDRINKAGGINGHPIELITEDNGCDPAKAAGALTKLVRQDKVVAVIGPIFAGISPTTAALAEREKIPNIILCPSDRGSRERRYKWVFFIPHNEVIVAQKIADYMVQAGIKSAITFAANEPMWIDLAKGVKDFGTKKGITVVEFKETHGTTDVDTTPQLAKMKPVIEEKKIQVLVAATHGGMGAVIGKNMKTLGMTIPVIGSHAYGIPFTISIGGDAVEGVKFPTEKVVVPHDLDPNEPHDKLVIDFCKRFEERYKKAATVWSANGHDAIHMLAKALAKSGNDRGKLRDVLESQKGYVGTNGLFQYSATDHDGLDEKGLVWVEIRGGKFRLMR
ncbi:MAG: ABC transporter substrate-binding protein [Candidatus Methanomethylicaceae archaeon]